ncbi:MAG: flippase-like domain-containing protein [Fibromonadaceae bacterium]|nr:flippase-like domain-containing protein [Fibromonadaceae bacterium]
MYSIPSSFKLSFKFVVSMILVALILWKFPIFEIIENLRSIKITWFLAAFLLGELIIINQAFRWYYLLIIPKEQKPKFSVLLKYTAVGYFFNIFTPGSLGGDAYRSIALGKVLIANSVASVFINKISGLLALCLLFWIAYPYSEWVPEQASWFMAAASLFLIIFCLFIIFNPIKKGKLGEIAEKLREYRKHPLRLLAAVLGSLLMQTLVVFMQISQFYAVGIEVSLAFVFIIVPTTVLLTTIPISFNGIGVREWSMLSLTAALVNSEQLLASMLLGYTIIILQALQGWIFFIIETCKNRKFR